MKARLSVENHRGAIVPRTLGLWLAGSAVVSTGIVAWAEPDGPVGRAGWGALIATLVVFAAGLIDDVVGRGPRGIRNHVRALAAGEISSGIIKLVVLPGAAVVAIALQGIGSGPVRLAGVVLVAGCANLWNGLDVRPGRALKFGVVAMIGLDVGIFMSGVVVVESVYGWPGIGQLMWQAIQDRDIPIIMGVTLTAAIFIVLGNLLADVIAPLIDPRIRLR
jgi:hypothetical protein